MRPGTPYFSRSFPGFRVTAIDKRRLRMALARVVTFEGVGRDRIGQMNREMEGREQPEGLNAREFDRAP